MVDIRLTVAAMDYGDHNYKAQSIVDLRKQYPELTFLFDQMDDLIDSRNEYDDERDKDYSFLEDRVIELEDELYEANELIRELQE